MENSVRKILLIAVFILAVSGIVYSHPHVFIDAKIQIFFHETGFAGFKVEWIFDDMFSSTIITDFDKNKNGTFEVDEIDAVREGAFSNLRNYNYFILLVSRNKRVVIESVEDFNAEIIQGKVGYNFFVPFETRADSQKKVIKIGVFDATYFCDVVFADESPITIYNHVAIESSYRLVKDASHAYWGGQITPHVILLQFNKR